MFKSGVSLDAGLTPKTDNILSSSTAAGSAVYTYRSIGNYYTSYLNTTTGAITGAGDIRLTPATNVIIHAEKYERQIHSLTQGLLA